MQKPNSKLVELESKIQILEHENELLLLKAEENLILNRAFEKLKNEENLSELLYNTLESICVIMDIPFAGIFDFNGENYDCISTYALFTPSDNHQMNLQLSQSTKKNLLSNGNCIASNNENTLCVKHNDNQLYFKNLAMVLYNSNFINNRIFIFANNDNQDLLKNRLPVIEKTIQTISTRLERIYYLRELDKLNFELDKALSQVHFKNEELSNKNKIITSQNQKINATLKHLRQTQNQLVQAEKMASIGVLTAGVAHEINNPLNFIQFGYEGMLECLEEIEYSDHAKVKVFSDAITTGIERTTEIVKKLNLLTQDNQNLKTTCSIHEIIEHCLSIISNQKSDRINIIKKYASKDLKIVCNKSKIQQVFISILSNAVQAISDVGYIEIKTCTKNDKVNIEISDTGCGIPEPNLNKIIDPFFTTKEAGQGIGLGLAISYSIIRDHYGEISFISEIGKGTTVLITLP